jgi:hypothetical protein
LKIKHFDDPSINRVYTAVESYLDGKINCEVAVDIMKGSELPTTKLAGIMRQLSDYGDKDRYSLLRRECRLFGLY